MKQTITRTEYLQLVGLMILGRDGKRNLERIRDAIVLIFDPQRFDRQSIEDRIMDAWWGNEEFEVDPLLERLQVTVVDDPDESGHVSIGREAVIAMVQAVERLKPFTFRLPEDVAEPVLAAQEQLVEAIR